jgi:putative hydrolase of the HAD superfamily
VPGAIKAISFDLWDTIVHDDSDEPKRTAKGLPGKREARRRLLHAALAEDAPIAYETVALAYDVADAAFNKVWREHHITWTIGERLGVALRGLGRTLPEAALAKVVAAHERMEIEIRPDCIEGIGEALAALATRYKLCIASDAIVSPGWALRELLESYGLARHFSAFAFSDEVGRAKPDRAMFASAASALGVELAQMVHVGDREHNDVKGPHALGMKAILFTGSRDADRAATTADAVCERHADLPAIVDRLSG